MLFLEAGGECGTEGWMLLFTPWKDVAAQGHRNADGNKVREQEVPGPWDSLECIIAVCLTPKDN